MCTVAAIPAAIAIGSSILSYTQQSKAADKAEHATEEQKAANLLALDEQAHQVDAQASDSMGIRAREASIERGRLAAVAADSGLGGQGATRLENASRFSEGFDITALEQNRKASQRQINRQRDAVRAGADARLASLPQPSLLGTGLQIAGAVANYEAKQPNGGK